MSTALTDAIKFVSSVDEAAGSEQTADAKVSNS